MAVAVAMLALGATTHDAAAQQQSADVHADYMYATRSKTNAWGAGAVYQVTWGGKSAPVNINTSIGPDYTKQENDGPSQTSVSFDVTAQPGGNGTVTPYVGGSASANWSGGDNKQWSGTKLGTELVGGLQVKLGSASKLSAKAEERYGYVQGQEHTLTTRAGLMLSF